MRRAITCVYCEPKSRRRIFECAEGLDIGALLAQGRAAARFHVRIVRAIDVRSELTLAPDAAPQTLLQLFGGRSLIGAADDAERAGRKEGGQQQFHPGRVRAGISIARKSPSKTADKSAKRVIGALKGCRAGD